MRGGHLVTSVVRPRGEIPFWFDCSNQSPNPLTSVPVAPPRGTHLPAPSDRAARIRRTDPLLNLQITASAHSSQEVAMYAGRRWF
jgi:hypothetical protein